MTQQWNDWISSLKNEAAKTNSLEELRIQIDNAFKNFTSKAIPLYPKIIAEYPWYSRSFNVFFLRLAVRKAIFEIRSVYENRINQLTEVD